MCRECNSATLLCQNNWLIAYRIPHVADELSTCNKERITVGPQQLAHAATVFGQRDHRCVCELSTNKHASMAHTRARQPGRDVSQASESGLIVCPVNRTAHLHNQQSAQHVPQLKIYCMRRTLIQTDKGVRTSILHLLQPHTRTQPLQQHSRQKSAKPCKLCVRQH